MILIDSPSLKENNLPKLLAIGAYINWPKTYPNKNKIILMDTK